MTWILVAADDRSFLNKMEKALRKDGLASRTVMEAKQLQELVKLHPDLMILDQSILEMQTNLQEIRKEVWMPVIILGAPRIRKEKISGFRTEEDDYIIKPCIISEIIESVDLLLFRTGKEKQVCYRSRDLVYDYARGELKKRGKDIKLSPTELHLLELFLANRNFVLTREILMDKVWFAKGYFVDQKTLNVNIRRMREKIEDNPRNPFWIKTVFGIGYKWNDKEV